MISKKILLNNIKFADEKGPILNNVNLSINLDENLVIIPKSSNDQKSCLALLGLLGNILKPTSGSIKFDTTPDNRLLIGYKNFEPIFKKGVKVDELINTLIKTQNVSKENLSEIQELRTMLKINEIGAKLSNNLNTNQSSLLHLLIQLIVKPHTIITDFSELPGSTAMKIAIASYLNDYCQKYKISIILSNTDKQIIDIIADRKIVISETKIITDSLINKKYEIENVNVDNKTKSFDLEDDILAVLKSPVNDALQNSYDPFNESFDNNDYELDTFEPESKLIKDVTKALSDQGFDGNIQDEIKEPSSLTNDLFTIKYDDEETSNLTPTKEMEEKISLTERFTGSLEFEKEEILNKTRQLNEDSRDVLQDIKISKNTPLIPTKSITRPLSSENESVAEKTGFLHDLRETYGIRKELEQQIKSSNFVSLTADLQAKVYSNYDRADQLIKETDPDGIYDPYKTKSQDFETTNLDNKNPTVTKMLIEEEIYTSSIDTDEYNNEQKTSIVTSNISDDTLNSIIGNMETSAVFNNEDDFSIKTNKVETNEYDKYTVTVPVENDDLTYIDNEKKKRPKWKNKFFKKEVDKNLVEEIYGTSHNRKKTRDVDDNIEETDEFNDFTRDLLKDEGEKQLDKSVEQITKTEDNKPSTTYFEYDDKDDTFSFTNTTSNLENENKSKTTIIRPTRQFKTRRFSTTATKNDGDYSPIKTMAIKQRTKKNMIERLYDEAVADDEIIEDFKSKKNK